LSSLISGSLLGTSFAGQAANGLAITPGTNAFHFDGITHLEMRSANGGNQFSIEPPSPSLAVGNGWVVEGVNNAFQVYSLSGVPQLPVVISTNQLFGLGLAIDRSVTPNVYGPYPTDMRVFWDPDVRRWFVLQRVAANDRQGYPLPESHLYLAVSQTEDPTGVFNIYVRDTTGDSSRGCPCVGDYPQIGADKAGFYISANEFNFFGGVVGVSILAISKAALAAGTAQPVAFEFLIPRQASQYAFTIHPATTPPGGAYFQQNGGVEYFVSSQAITPDSMLAVFAMSNTNSLATANPSLSLVQVTVPALPYASPPLASQPLGVLPYGQSVGASISPPIDGGDTRVQSVIYAGSRLYVTLGTQVFDSHNTRLAGGAYFVISMAYRGGLITAAALRQGYLMVEGNHLLRPAIAVDAQGRGAIAFTLTGPGYYPSAAFVPFSAFAPAGTIQVAAPGAFPEDGFTGYDPPFFARWGDYSSAVVGGNGQIWLTVQYIPNKPRTEFANWGTSVIAVNPQ
jgi:hypothetical protein